MVFLESLLNVSDNSGVSLVKSFKVLDLNKFRSINYGIGFGSIVLVSVRSLKNKNKKNIKYGQIFKAFLFRSKSNYYKISGFSVKSSYTSVILLKKTDNSVIGNKIKSFLLSDVKKYNFHRLISLSFGSF